LIAPGDTFLISDNAAGVSPHLWIVVVANECGQLLMVNVTTWRETISIMLDDSCILDVYDHAFIKHKPFIAYGEARTPPQETMEKLLESGLLTKHQPCSNALLLRIREGLLHSPFAAPKHKNML